jgi:hypothetical protein
MVFNATFNNIFSYIVAVSFIGGGNRSTQRKPLTCHKAAYHHLSCEFESRSWRGVLDTTLCDKVCL